MTNKSCKQIISLLLFKADKERLLGGMNSHLQHIISGRVRSNALFRPRTKNDHFRTLSCGRIIECHRPKCKAEQLDEINDKLIYDERLNDVILSVHRVPELVVDLV